jgi:hypothetical protein
VNQPEREYQCLHPFDCDNHRKDRAMTSGAPMPNDAMQIRVEQDADKWRIAEFETVLRRILACAPFLGSYGDSVEAEARALLTPPAPSEKGGGK